MTTAPSCLVEIVARWREVIRAGRTARPATTTTTAPTASASTQRPNWTVPRARRKTRRQVAESRRAANAADTKHRVIRTNHTAAAAATKAAEATDAPRWRHVAAQVTLTDACRAWEHQR